MRWCNRRALPSCPAELLLQDQDSQETSSQEGLLSPAARQATRDGTRDRTAKTRYARPLFGRSLSSSLSVLIASRGLIGSFTAYARSCSTSLTARNLSASAMGMKKLMLVPTFFSDMVNPETLMATTLPNRSTIAPPLLPP